MKYNVGDKVVFVDSFMHSDVMTVSSTELDSVYLNGGRNFAVNEMLRLATYIELELGHRIDEHTDYVTDIRNHVSPMTIINGD